jgi:hypothetical protein
MYGRFSVGSYWGNVLLLERPLSDVPRDYQQISKKKIKVKGMP